MMDTSPINGIISIITEELESLLNENYRIFNTQIFPQYGCKEKLISYVFNRIFRGHEKFRFQLENTDLESLYTNPSYRDRVRGYIRQGISEIL